MTINPFDPPLTESEIVDYYRAGILLPALLRPLNTQDQEQLRERLSARHNAGDIDVLALVATPDFQNLERRDFFTVQQIYSGVIPLLDTQPQVMLAAVQ